MSDTRYQMDGHKLFWHLDRVAAWQAGELIPPIYVEISPVSFCNHRCVFCGLDFAQDEKHQLETEVICERLVEMGNLGVKSVMFAGEGEPLLHPGLDKMVVTAKKSGVDVSITTNGSVGRQELWTALIPNLSWLRFSVDAGSQATYSRVHGVGDSAFTKTLESIRQALKVREESAAPCTIGVQFLLIKDNISDIEQAIHTFGGMGVDYLSFKPYSEHPQMLNKTQFTYTKKTVTDIDQRVRQNQRKYRTRLIFRKEATDTYAEGRKAFSQCCALPFWGYISSKGDFYTCSVFLNDDRFKIGNIHTEDMQSILFGERRRESVYYGRNELAVGRECRVNCRMARINEFLDMLATPPEHLNFI